LQKEKEAVLKGNQAFCFRMAKSSLDVAKGAFYLEGEFQVFLGKEGELPFCAQHEPKKYTLQFECINGRLMLKSLKKEGIS